MARSANAFRDSLRRRVQRRIARLCCAALALFPLAGLTAATPTGIEDLVRRVAPSVVTVMVEMEVKGAGERAAERANSEPSDNVGELIRRLLSGGTGNQSSDQRAAGALGSGFVIRADGLIVTNRHVIADARIIRVRLTDGRELPAKLVGADAVTDIAVLKVEADRLPVLHLGASRDVAVGAAVIAIGNPYGLGQSVSAGIISARGRTLEDDPYIDFLQTDAAINRGNSGGPLLALDGTVVGVTSAIFSPSGGSVGLGFAIPADTVVAITAQLVAHGTVERGYLGISAQAITPLLAKALGMPAPRGALVCAVEAGGPAAGALLVGDVLLSIGTSKVTFKEMSKITARLTPNTLVVANILRGGTPQSVGLTIGRLPVPPTVAAGNAQDTWIPALRLGVANTTVDIRKKLKAGDEANGLIVTQLRPSGAGALAGLKIGDMITHVANRQLTDVADLVNVAVPTHEAPLLVRIVREGAATFVAITGEAELQFP